MGKSGSRLPYLGGSIFFIPRLRDELTIYPPIRDPRSGTPLVDGAGGWMKFEESLKKSRSWDSVPARTADCNKDFRVPVTGDAMHTYDHSCYLVYQKLLFCGVFDDIFRQGAASG